MEENFSGMDSFGKSEQDDGSLGNLARSPADLVTGTTHIVRALDGVLEHSVCFGRLHEHLNGEMRGEIKTKDRMGKVCSAKAFEVPELIGSHHELPANWGVYSKRAGYRQIYGSLFTEG